MPMPPIDLDALSRTLRPAMLRLTQRLLPSQDLAEDVVQETLLALIESSTAMTRAQDPRRYVFGVLKNKIADALRKRYRQATDSLDANEEALDALMFDARGAWQHSSAPSSWNTPETRLHKDQFFAMVDLCVNHLPPKSARVFGLKVLLEFDAEEVCTPLGLSKTDYWQCLSRARKQLQLCLNQRWFNGAAP